MWGGFQSNGSSAGESSGTDNQFSVPKSMNQGTVSPGFCLQGGNGMSLNGCSIYSLANTESRSGVMNHNSSHEFGYNASCASNFDVFGNPSSHVAPPSQLQTMHPHLDNNLLFGSVHSALQSSSINIFNGDQFNITQIKIDEEQRKSMNHNSLQSQVFDASNALQNSLESSIACSSMERSDYGEQNKNGLIRILQKELTNSDVSNVGRIVLPKKEAEANLPRLGEKEVMVLHMKDFVFSHTWSFKYRYWPNNKSRMYVLETTGDFVRAHGLRAGDLFIIYKKIETGNYLVMGEKELRHVNEVLCNLSFQNNINRDYSENGEDKRSGKRQRNEEKCVNLDFETDPLMTKSEEESFLNLMSKFGGCSPSSSSVNFAGSL